MNVFGRKKEDTAGILKLDKKDAGKIPARAVLDKAKKYNVNIRRESSRGIKELKDVLNAYLSSP